VHPLVIEKQNEWLQERESAKKPQTPFVSLDAALIIEWADADV